MVSYGKLVDGLWIISLFDMNDMIIRVNTNINSCHRYSNLECFETRNVTLQYKYENKALLTCP